VGSSIDSCVCDGSENTRKGKVKKGEERRRRRRSKRQKRWKESFYLFAVGIGIGFAASSSSFPLLLAESLGLLLSIDPCVRHRGTSNEPKARRSS
jgi:hypothetical protein